MCFTLHVLRVLLVQRQKAGGSVEFSDYPGVVVARLLACRCLLAQDSRWGYVGLASLGRPPPSTCWLVLNAHIRKHTDTHTHTHTHTLTEPR